MESDADKKAKRAAYARAWRRRQGIPERRRAAPLDPEEAVRLYREGLSCSQAAAVLGCSAEHVRRTLKRAGEPRRGEGAAGRPREENPFYRSGRSVDKNGYVLVLHPDRPGYIREHRLVMERHLGRELLPQEVVHHRNGVRDDNRIENLALYERNSDHLRDELTGRVPRWSQEGREAIQAAVRRKRGRRRASSPPESGSDGQP